MKFVQLDVNVMIFFHGSVQRLTNQLGLIISVLLYRNAMLEVV